MKTLADVQQISEARPQRPSVPTGTFGRAIRSVIALMLREMSARYGRSPGGYIWAVLEPVGVVVVLSVGLSFLIRVPPMGNSFLLFYATGYLPFFLYSSLQAHVSASLVFSKQLLMYPAVSWIDAVMARFLLNLITGVGVTAIVMAGIYWYTETNTFINLQPILVSMALMSLLGLGLGTLNCALFGLFPAWQQVFGIISRPLFIAAGVFFLLEDLPQYVQDILWWTPWIHGTTLFREGMYPTYQPDFTSISLMLAWGLGPLFFGLLLLRRFRQDILMQ